ncbi:hypothetical protein [Desulfoluna butyratoxydans]|uniref:Tetratricopeptide-like helical domain n=1 Tax=Desulfoluna butyratoxydans TaxID=231438 RepID=A0A4U8YQV0_9BACT|nr:hypothetical protein [Desulfoluna butyratoxydans]VFQ46251.1 tetratricopeptide-like helical domain [Desulfoluna butyratoxydans]
MKYVMWIRLLLAAVTALSLSACGGSGGGGAAPGPGITLSGVVEDGPVSKATVYALNRDGSDGLYGPCVTDEQGRFTVTVGAGVDLKSLMLFARGGKDGTTGPDGLDFRGVVMMAPLEMYEGKTRSVVVSPVTTLVGLDVANGSSLSAARTAVAGRLKVSEDKLTARPSVEGGHFHAKTMMLSLVATARRTKGCKGSAFEGLTFSADGLPDTSEHPELDEAVIAIKEAVEKGEAPGEVFVRRRLLACLTEVLDANSPSSSKEDPLFKTRASRLIGDILAAAGGRPIHLESMAPERVIRWVLRTSGIETYDTFLGDTFPVLIGWVRDNTEIVSIITPVAAKYDIREPLFASELLGDDNAKRLDYYFNSDASHLYKAEKLVETVRDDTVNDYILERVAHGLAEAGLFLEAKTILDTKVFSTMVRAEGFRRLGKTLISFNERTGGIPQENILQALEKAESLYKKKIEAVGKAYFDDKDAAALNSLINQYREAGEMDKADSVVRYVKECSEAMAEVNTSSLNRLVVSMKKAGDSFVEDGNEAQAALYPGMMLSLSKKVPADDAVNPDYPNKDDDPHAVDYYRKRVFCLSWVVQLYASMYETFGDEAYRLGGMNAYEEIRALCDSYPFTKSSTWFYVATYVIPGLCTFGEMPLVDSLISEAPAAYKNRVYAFLATSKAVTSEDIDDALAVVDRIVNKDKVKETKEKINALTYFAQNKGSKRMAATLIALGPGRYADAVKALEKAQAILDDFTTDDKEAAFTVKILQGYPKLAYLYSLMNKKDTQLAFCETTEAVARDISGALWKVRGLCEASSCWISVGRLDRAAQCLVEARSAADGVVGKGADASEVAEMYLWLARSQVALGDKGRLLEVVSTFATKSVRIFDESITDEQWASGQYGEHDELLTLRGGYLIRAAKVLISLGYTDEAISILNKAIATKAAFYEDDKCVKLCVGSSTISTKSLTLANAYTLAGAVDKSVALSMSMGNRAEINRGIKLTAATMAEIDDFSEMPFWSPEKPENWVAQVDTDGDGLPDFFSPLASPEDIAASGLTLDPDSDGDGIPDTTDTRPLYAD